MVDISKIPTSPGIYQYKNSKGKIIYIGKAKNLKKRVSQYFQKKDHDPKTEQLVKNIQDVDFIATDTESEALLLENTLIKKHRPKYNIDLKDSKRYAYIKVTDDDFPRLVIARNKTKDGKFYGPFVSGSERNYIMEAMKKTFQLRTCKRMPKKPCLRYHINLCDAPCVGKISKSEYKKKIQKITMILKGKNQDLHTKLEQDMISYSKKQKFEEALKIREQMSALEYLKEKQNMERKKKYNEDIINYIIKDGVVYVMLFNIYKGTLENKQEFTFDINPDFFEEFIFQYYLTNPIPREIIVPQAISGSINKFLNKKSKRKIKITKPLKGEKFTLLKLVEKNIELANFGDLTKLNELRKKLKLNEEPTVIECFDISHLGGTSTVASMVQFRNGKPDKSNYRRYKIRTVHKIDDFASMAEVVKRRYTRLKNENTPFPNLIVIDGGKGQLSSTLAELKKLDVKIPTISIAKRLEEIFVPGLEFSIRLKKSEKALQFIQEIRDEAHRFAITYNRLLRKKKLIPK